MTDNQPSVDQLTATQNAPAPGSSAAAPADAGAPPAASAPQVPAGGVVPGGAAPAAPAAPAAAQPNPKMGFMEGAARQLNPQYGDDGKRSEAARRPSVKGFLGSLLAGAMEGLYGGTTGEQREGESSANAGAAGANAYIQQRDLIARKQAQQSFENQQKNREQQRADAAEARETAESGARIVNYNMEDARINQEIQQKTITNPLEVDALVQNRTNLALDTQKNMDALGYFNPQTYTHISEVPDAVVRGWASGTMHAITLHGEAAEAMKSPDGSVTIYQVTPDKQRTTAPYDIYTVKPNGDLEKSGTIPAGGDTQGHARLVQQATFKDQADAKAKIAAATESVAKARESNAAAAKNISEAHLNDMMSGFSDGKVNGGVAGTGAGNNSGLVGQPYLQTLPASVQPTIKAFGEGRNTMSASMARSKQGMMMLEMVNRAYPGYDITKTDSYHKMRLDYSDGKTAQGLVSVNKVLGHLSRMYDHVSAWSTLPGISTLDSLVGGDAKALEEDRHAVAAELTKAYASGAGGMTQGERDEWLSELKSSNPVSLRRGIQEVSQLLLGVVKATNDQWKQVMPEGNELPHPGMSPAGQQAFNHINGISHNVGDSILNGGVPMIVTAVDANGTVLDAKPR